MITVDLTRRRDVVGDAEPGRVTILTEAKARKTTAPVDRLIQKDRRDPTAFATESVAQTTDSVLAWSGYRLFVVTPGFYRAASLAPSGRCAQQTHILVRDDGTVELGDYPDLVRWAKESDELAVARQRLADLRREIEKVEGVLFVREDAPIPQGKFGAIGRRHLGGRWDDSSTGG